MTSRERDTIDAAAQTPLDRRLGAGMFWLTIVWLGLVGAGLHLLADVAGTAAAEVVSDGEGQVTSPGRFHGAAMACLGAAVALLPLYWLEWLAHRLAGGTVSGRHLAAALFPPLRIGARDHVSQRTLWLPACGWARATDDLEAELERKLSIPMLVVALFVLPVIAIEFLWADRIAQDARLGLATQLAGAAIWLAFAVEFLVLISIVRDRWLFVRRHWLDLAIICLPLLGFLRVLRMGRLGRLLRLNQLTKVSRTARAFRMKGLALRVWRALLLLEVIDRVLRRDDVQRLARLQRKLADKEREVQLLQAEIEELERKVESAAEPVWTEGAESGRQSA